ncbi:MAG: DUF92 domain-containing protein [Methanomassiliicoccales archaeon]|nr:DUF92 domain-containing protein [Methanomassiliicoccales archaeon]NYT16030.1 DUF92 domain-containing protein [Methanomassiliicoccales archaeon]
MIDWVSLAIVLLLCLALAILSYWFGLLTASGSISAFALGIVIGALGSISWLLILVIFTILGFLVTRYKLQEKIDGGLQEGKKGERTYKNVLANGLIPALIALFAWIMGVQQEAIPAIMFLSAISVAASDTVASEMGILSDKTKLITSLRPVPPGTDGGVSTYGTMWALLAAIAASVFGWILLFPNNLIDPLIIVPMIAGFLGCNVDSYIGATLERRGYIGKLGTNIISMASGAIVALIILLVV